MINSEKERKNRRDSCFSVVILFFGLDTFSSKITNLLATLCVTEHRNLPPPFEAFRSIALLDFVEVHGATWILDVTETERRV